MTTTRICGEKYNFVNPIFFKNKKIFYNIKDMNLLINFGSTDVKNYTIKILKILSDIKFFGKIIIIITSKSNNYRTLVSSIKNFENLNISLAIDKNQKQLSNIYNKCLLCIGSGGNSLFERLASNLYSIVIPSNKLEEKSINYNLYSESVLFIKNLNTLNVLKLNNILMKVLKKSTLDILGHQQRIFDDKGIERIERIIFDL